MQSRELRKISSGSSFMIIIVSYRKRLKIITVMHDQQDMIRNKTSDGCQLQKKSIATNFSVE